MNFPGKEALVSQVVSLTLECTLCGRTRLKKPADLRRFGVTGSTPLDQVAPRLVCGACRAEGAPDRNISVQAVFSNQLDREKAEAARIRNREALYSVRRAKGA